MPVDAEELVLREVVESEMFAGVFKRGFFREFRQFYDGMFRIRPVACGGSVVVDHVAGSRVEGDDGVAAALVESLDKLRGARFFTVGTVQMVA